MEYPQLIAPPIDEVVCGFIFAAQHVDVMDFGVYWESLRKEFPRSQVHPALLDETPLLQLGTVPQRSWLISEDDSRVLQLQHDRFYMNWRRRDVVDYPRFRDHDGREGIRTQAIKEFERFSRWLVDRTGIPLTFKRFELSKIDVLRKDEHYKDIAHLGDILTVARVFADIQISDPQLLHLRLVERHREATTNVQIIVDSGQVRIETRHMFPVQEDIQAAFDAANARVNQVFFGLFRDGLNVFGVQS